MSGQGKLSHFLGKLMCLNSGIVELFLPLLVCSGIEGWRKTEVGRLCVNITNFLSRKGLIPSVAVTTGEV